MSTIPGFDVGDCVVGIDDLRGRIEEVIEKVAAGKVTSRTYLVRIEGLEGLGVTQYREDEIRPQ